VVWRAYKGWGTCCAMGVAATAIGEPRDEAIEEQDGEDSGVGERADDRGFYEPVVVDYAEGGAEIDEAMEGLPAFAAQAADPARGGGERQRDEAAGTRRNPR
jgi:hypothetical protein